jgi:hypothetical protein
MYDLHQGLQGDEFRQALEQAIDRSRPDDVKMEALTPNIALQLTSGVLVVARLRARHHFLQPPAAERER